MGIILSQQVDFRINFAITQAAFEHIEKESPTRVYNRILDEKFASKIQMYAVSVMIYEKAILNLNLSVKCAQLVKELEVEEIDEDEERILFSEVFTSTVYRNVAEYVEIDEQGVFNENFKQRFRNAAIFLGNLYNIGVFPLGTVAAIARMLSENKTRMSKFFMDTILKTTSAKMTSEENATKKSFRNLMDIPAVHLHPCPWYYNPEEGIIASFRDHLFQIRSENFHKFYENFDDFLVISKEAFFNNIRFYYNDILNNQDFLCIYRDIALEINQRQPELFQKYLKAFFKRSIERYEVVMEIDYDGNIKQFIHLGNMTVAFYTAGLIENDIIEQILAASLSKKWARRIFIGIYLDVLKNCETKNEHFQHYEKIFNNLTQYKMFLSIVEEHVKFGQESASKGTGYNKVSLSKIANQSDMLDYVLNKQKSSLTTFQCKNQNSCYFASKRSLDILMRHIGNKFFTPERIEICTRMMDNWTKIDRAGAVNSIYEREAKTLLPYFQDDLEPNSRLINFTNFLACSYNQGTVKHEIVRNWQDLLKNAADERNHMFSSKFSKIHNDFILKVGESLVLNDIITWMKKSDYIMMLDGLVQSFKNESEFKNLTQLQQIPIDNDEITLTRVSYFILDFYVKEKPNPAFISSLLTALADKYKPKLNKTALLANIETAFCYEFKNSCRRNNKPYWCKISVEVLVDLAAVLCSNCQLSKSALFTIFDIITSMVITYLSSALELTFYSYKSLQKFLDTTELLTAEDEKNLKMIIEKVNKAIELEPDDYYNMKEVLKFFIKIQADSKKNRGKEKCGQKSQEVLPSTSGINSAQVKKSPSVNIESITTYTQYCELYHSINPKTVNDVHKLFNCYLISNLKFTSKVEISGFCAKIVERVLANECTPFFFANATCLFLKSSILNHMKERGLDFLCDSLTTETFKKFKNQKVLLEYICEIYNSHLISDESMNSFVDKLIKGDDESIKLMFIYIRNCQANIIEKGDVEQLLKIKNLSKNVSIKSDNYELSYKFFNLLNTAVDLIKIIQTRLVQVIESDMTEEILRKSFIDPKVAASASVMLDERSQENIMHSCLFQFLNFPKYPHSVEFFLNRVQFCAELFNLEVMKKEFLNEIIENFLKRTNDDISCMSLDILFTTCGAKMEVLNKPKLDTYFKIIETVIIKSETSTRAEYFKKLIKLRANDWKDVEVPGNFYEDFLMLYSVNDGNVKELVSHLKNNDEEIKKFIQVLWKILLKEASNAAYANLCEKISQLIPSFLPALTAFLTARCKTFESLSDELYSDDVKERLGKVITFAAEIYKRGLVSSDQDFEMWINKSLVEKITPKHASNVYEIVSKSEKFKASKNEKLKKFIENLKDIYSMEMNAKVESMIKELNKLKSGFQTSSK